MQLWAAGPLYHHLKNEGYVVTASGSHRAGYSASGKAQFVAVQAGPDHDKMLRNLFDPLMHISHHVRFHILSMLKLC